MIASAHVWFWQTPSWHWAEFWALVIVLLPSLLALLAKYVFGRRGASLLLGLVNGRDGRWSTSKTSMLLWTYSIWFAFLTILLHTEGAGLERLVFHSQYLVLLGVPAAAAVIAKGLTQQKVETGRIVSKPEQAPETNPLAGIGQLVSDDSGQPDLLDFQYFGFNLILLAYFFTRFLGHATGLPLLPDSLVGLSGVSGASYVAKKGLEQDSPPSVRAVVPEAASPGETVSIRGVNLASPENQNVAVLVGKLAATVRSVTVGDYDTEIEAVVPMQAAEGGAALTLVSALGVKSSPHPFTVLPPAPADETLALKQIG
ncbi:MAG TPA: hypothetical protein VF002_03170 [Gaiellaceae bacterium]